MSAPTPTSTPIAKALERFSFASWDSMAAAEGITEKVYSPYSAFVAMLLTALLSKESTKEEILHALQLETVNADDLEHPERMAHELVSFILQTEYTPCYYDPAFDRVFEYLSSSSWGVKCRGFTATQKTRVYAEAMSMFGTIEELFAAIDGATEEGKNPECYSYSSEFPYTVKIRQLADVARVTADFKIVMTSANRLWPNSQKNIDMSEFAILTDILKTRVTPVRFPQPGVNEINKAIEDVTNGLIKDVLDASSVDESTSCVLTNAVYFLGKWANPFKKNDPSPERWTNLDGTKRPIGLMHHENYNRLLKVWGAKLITLGYKASSYSMTIVLPNSTGESAFRKVAKSITPELLESARKSEPVKMRLFVPKFETRWGTESLKHMLEDLGAHEIFHEGQAKFVADSYVSDVLQQAFIKVDEEGTEAAAATCVHCISKGLFHLPSLPPMKIVCDHPFMYFVTNESTGAILFMGSCINPKTE